MSRNWAIVFIVLIVILFGASGFLGYMSFNLSGEIDTLDGDVQTFKADTSSQFDATRNSIDVVGTDLTDFKTETGDTFSTVQSDITGLNSNLTAFQSDTASKFTATQNNINTLNADLTGLGTELSESTINARQIYDDVIDGVVKITGDIGTGSGFIYSETGHIVTCWHVVDGQSYIDVTLHDGSVFRATIVGSNRDSDVALIKINGATSLQPLTLADSSTLVPGEPVILVGNPLGIFETIVCGVISRTKGMVRVANVGWVSNLIQYDAAQNGGNSGGPVFNNEGQVIGIADNSNGSAEGIHNAVSSNKVKRVIQAILDDGSFTSATLPGTWTMFNLDPDTAIDRGLDNTFGVIFTVATNMGQLQVDDICTAVDGMVIQDFADLFSYIAEFKSVGDTIVLSVISTTGTEKEVSIVLTEGWVY